VVNVKQRLEARGWQCWLDEEDIGPDLRSSMAQGIEECKVVVLFLSKEYIKKVCDAKKSDNVVFEYALTMNQKAGRGGGDDDMFVPVIMESFRTDSGFLFPDEPRSWQGRLSGEIGPTMMQVRMNDCFGDDDALDKKIDELDRALHKLIPEKQDALCQEKEINRRSGSQALNIKTTNYHLISPSIQGASAVVFFITDGFELDRFMKHELATACSFGRPAIPILIGNSTDKVKWPPPGFTHELKQEECLRVKSLSKLGTPQELQQCVDRIMSLIVKAAEAPDKFLLQPIVTSASIQRTMPLRKREIVRPMARGGARAPLEIYSEAQINAMTDNLSGRQKFPKVSTP